MQRAVFIAVITWALGGMAAIAQDAPPARGPSTSALDQKGEKTTLKTAADKPFAAYLVGSKESPRGVLVIPAGVGLNDAARQAAALFATLGYRAAVIDISDGHIIADPGKARAHVQTLDQNDANAKYRAALEALRERGRKLAVVGWCFGAEQAIEASLAAPDLIVATVLHDGAPKIDPPRLVHLKSPVLAVLTADQSSGNQMKTLEAGMKQAGAALEVQKTDQKMCASETPSAVPQVTRDFLNRYLK